MSTDSESGTGKVMDDALRDAQEQVAAATEEERQLELLDPISPEEMAEAQEVVGPMARRLAVLGEARKRRRGRPRGRVNKRTDDFSRYLLGFGQHPAITMMQLQSTPPEILVERSASMDPAKRRMSYGDAQQLRVRCAEGLLPYIESKKPVAVDVSAKGDFSLVVPGMNLNPADEQSAIDGDFYELGPYEPGQIVDSPHALPDGDAAQDASDDEGGGR